MGSVSALLTLLYPSPPAFGAEPSVDQCLDASEHGQRQRDGGELQAARASFVTCSNQACPGVVQKDCVEWLGDVERRLPSVVFRVRDPGGNDIADVELRVDTASEAQLVGGDALVMDPGRRSFHFSRAGFEQQSIEVVVREGEQRRIVDVVLRPLEESAAKPAVKHPPRLDGPRYEGGGLPTLAWVLGGVGAVALGSYAYFGLQAKSERDDLDACKPTCIEADVDSARTKWIVSNVSFGVAVLAVGAAVWISLDQPSPQGSGGVRAGVAPAPGGGVGLFAGRF
ncbi:MAG: hypothetical protein R3B89_09370 [Polyangiaceae bacterium]